MASCGRQKLSRRRLDASWSRLGSSWSRLKASGKRLTSSRTRKNEFTWFFATGKGGESVGGYGRAMGPQFDPDP